MQVGSTLVKCLSANLSVYIRYDFLATTMPLIIVTGFAKTVPNGTRIEIPFIAWHES